MAMPDRVTVSKQIKEQQKTDLRCSGADVRRSQLW